MSLRQLEGAKPAASSSSAPLARLARATRRVRDYQRQFGAAYVVALLLRSIVDRALIPIDTYLLRVEGTRGVLGPAHRGYRGHTALDNRQQWSAFDWSYGGEEWGPPEGRAALVEDELLRRLPPDPVIVEIGPGAGRWSAELQPLAEMLVLVDVTDAAVEICRHRFGEVDNVEVLRTDGASLPGIAPGSVDVVWSMEAFVHMAPVDVAAYIGEIARVLTPNGFALIHHAGRYHRRGWRAPMTKELFARLAAERGLSVERQFDSWGDGAFNVHASHDLITILRQHSALSSG